MTVLKYSIVSFAFALLLPPAVNADSLPRYIWSDSKGFVEPDAACVVKAEEKVSLAVAQKPGGELNSFSKMKGHGFFGKLMPDSLLDRSILFVQSYEADNVTANVYVVAVPKNAVRPKSGGISKRGDEGALEKNVLQEIGNFVIKVTAAPALSPAPAKPFPVPVKDSYWQAALENDQYVTLSCGDSAKSVQYTLFDIYDSKSIDPIAQVAIAGTETKVFEHVQVITPDEANQEAIGEAPPPVPPAPPADNGGGSVTPGTPGTAPGTPSDPSSPVTPGEEDEEGEKPGLGYIVCTTDKKIPVLDKDLNPIGEATQFEMIVPSQTWDEKQKSTHLEVQFPSRETPVSGWIPRTLVQTKEECEPYKKSQQGKKDDDDSNVDHTAITLDPSVSRKDCCKFPTTVRPSQSYAEGKLKFRAGRSGGRRLHAGVDLYRKRGEAAVAVASGTVIRGHYYFYQGVFAVEVKHPLFIARYGEILGKPPKGVLKGKNVVAGQTVGLIGKVNSGCCTPMLHFELYKGTSSGPLSRYRRPPYDRRSDVMDPTDLLRKWEKTQFGKSF